MGSVNKVILVGNLGRDAELRYTPGGAAVATLNLATTEVWNDKDGQHQEKTEWHRIVLWGKQAESLQEYLTKGKQIYVEGRLQTRQWDDKDGNKRYTTEIKADGSRCSAAVAVAGAAHRRIMDRGRGARGRRRWRRAADGADHRRRYSVLIDVMATHAVASLRCPSPSVAIFEPHDVVELGRRDFQDVAVFDRRHAMHGQRRDVHRVARPHLALLDRAALRTRSRTASCLHWT